MTDDLNRNGGEAMVDTNDVNVVGETGRETLVGQAAGAVDVSAPAAGETVNVTLVKGQTANLTFDATAATPIVEGNDFVLTFDTNGDGEADSRIVFQNLVEESQGADAPVLVIGGIELSAGLLIGQAQALAEGETLETAAGAGAGPTGGGGSTYSDDLGSAIDLLNAQGVIDPTELQFGLLSSLDEITDPAQGTLLISFLTTITEVEEGPDGGITGSFGGGFEDWLPNHHLTNGDAGEDSSPFLGDGSREAFSAPMRMVLTFVPSDNETLDTVVINELPEGVRLFIGGSEEGDEYTGGFPVTVSPSDFEDIYMLPPQHSDADITITGTATISDPDSGESATLGYTTVAVIDAVADFPDDLRIGDDGGENGQQTATLSDVVRTVSPSGGVVNSGDEEDVVTIPVTVEFADFADDSEAHELVIDGVPEGWDIRPVPGAEIWQMDGDNVYQVTFGADGKPVLTLVTDTSDLPASLQHQIALAAGVIPSPDALSTLENTIGDEVADDGYVRYFIDVSENVDDANGGNTADTSDDGSGSLTTNISFNPNDWTNDRLPDGTPRGGEGAEGDEGPATITVHAVATETVPEGSGSELTDADGTPVDENNQSVAGPVSVDISIDEDIPEFTSPITLIHDETQRTVSVEGAGVDPDSNDIPDVPASVQAVLDARYKVLKGDDSAELGDTVGQAQNTFTYDLKTDGSNDETDGSDGPTDTDAPLNTNPSTPDDLEAITFDLSGDVDSLLTSGGSVITLHQDADQPQVVWGIDESGNVIFAVHIDGTLVNGDGNTGNLTFVQYGPIDHNQPGDGGEGSHDENASFDLPIKLTDDEGDSVTATATINIEDDGPVITKFETNDGAEIRLDESVGFDDGDSNADDETSAPTAGAIGFATIAGSNLISYERDAGTDGEKSSVFSLTLDSNVGSGLFDTASGEAVVLSQVGDVITGTAGTGGAPVFTITVDPSTGGVTVEQFRALKHTDTDDHDEGLDPLEIAAGAVELAVTLTDGDDDTDSESVELGNLIKFEDDGPVVDVSVKTVGQGEDAEPATLSLDALDESTGANAGDSNAASDDTGNTVSDPTGGNAIGSITSGVNNGALGNLFDITKDAGTDGEKSVEHKFELTLEGAPGSTGGVATNLNVTQGTSNTDYVDTGIYLFLEGGEIVGRFDATSAAGFDGIAFRISLDDVDSLTNADLTFDQYVAIDHPDSGNGSSGTHDEFIDLLTSDSGASVGLKLTTTVTDGDDDTATDSATVVLFDHENSSVSIEDDGPVITKFETNDGAELRLDESLGVDDGDYNAADENATGASAGAIGYATIAGTDLIDIAVDAGTDGEKSRVFSLTLDSSVGSGLVDTASGDPVVLNQIGNVISGVADGETVFTITVDPATGGVTVEQFRALKHTDTDDHDEGLDPLEIAAGAVELTVTLTDGDDDTDSESVELGNLIKFEDDGPVVDVSVKTVGQGEDAEPATLSLDALDESTGTDAGDSNAASDDTGDTVSDPTGSNAIGSITSGVNNGALGNLFDITKDAGTDGEKSVEHKFELTLEGAPGSTGGIATNLNVTQGTSNTDYVDTGIYLFLEGGEIVGRFDATSAAGLDGIAFRISLDDVDSLTNADLTFDQYVAIDHPDSGNGSSGTHDEFIDLLTSDSGASVGLKLTTTVTDGDDDTATDSATVVLFDNENSSVSIEDDGPVITKFETKDGVSTQLTLDESVGVDAGDSNAADENTSGASTGAIGYATIAGTDLIDITVDAGTDGEKSRVFSLTLDSSVGSGLVDTASGEAVVLSQIGDVITGTAGGETVFTITVDPATGGVTVEQFRALKHGGTDDHDESIDPLEIATGAVELSVTLTDGDDDTDSESVELGNLIKFEDDGPTNNAAAVSGTVEEDNLADGNDEDASGDTVATGSVAGLVDFGADGAATGGGFSLASNLSNLPTLTSNGLPVSYAVSGDTLTASTTAGTVFTLKIEADGDYTFTLVDQIDHHPVNAADDIEDFLDLDLSSAVVATDGDGDSVTVDSGFTIRVQDDVPVALDDALSVTDESAGNVVTGNLLQAGESAGADQPGTIREITHDGVTYELAADGQSVSGGGSFDPATGILTITTKAGATLTVDMAGDNLGDYSYEGPATHPGEDFALGGGSFDGATYTQTNSATGVAVTLAGHGVQGGNPVDVLVVASEFGGLGIANVPQGTADSTAIDDGGVAESITISFSDAGGTVSSDYVAINLGSIDDSSTGEVVAWSAETASGTVTGTTSPGDTLLELDLDGITSVTLTAVGDNFTVVSVSTAPDTMDETFDYVLEDADGDQDGATLTVTVADDNPVADIEFNQDAEIRLDETENDGDDTAVDGLLADVTILGSNLFTDSSVFGADGAASTGATEFSLNIEGRQPINSGLVDAQTDEAIILTQEPGGDIVGSSASGGEVFRVSVNPSTGDVTVTQTRAVEHNDSNDPDEASSPEIMNSGILNLVATVTDADGDQSVDTLDLGSVIKFEDDGPTADLSAKQGAEIRLDETENDGDDTAVDGLLADVTVAGSALFTNSSVFGSDGPDAIPADATVYSLTLKNADSGLVDAVTNEPITLTQATAGGDIVGSSATGGVVFTISINPADGSVTVTQARAIEHNDASDPIETGTSSAVMGADIVEATVTVTDGDGDSHSDNAALGNLIKFEDDGPTAALSAKQGAEIRLDETDNDSDDNDVGGLLADVTVAGSALFANTSAFGSDGEAASNATVYSLTLNGAQPVTSGLLDAVTNEPITLSQSTPGGVITGSSATGGTVFTVSINPATGAVTVQQSRAIEHDDINDPVEDGASSAVMNSGLVEATVTVTDGDGDSHSDDAELGGLIKFEDDGPAFTVCEDSSLDESIDPVTSVNFADHGDGLKVDIVNEGQTQASYQNTFGYYFFNAAGEPMTGTIVAESVTSTTPVGDLVGSVTFDTATDVPVGATGMGFFLIPNGLGQNPAALIQEGQDVTFSQVGGEWVAFVNGTQLQGSGGADALFDNQALNPNNKEHLKDLTNVDGNQNWEDINAGGDNDYDDANLTVTVKEVATGTVLFNAGSDGLQSLAIEAVGAKLDTAANDYSVTTALESGGQAIVASAASSAVVDGETIWTINGTIDGGATPVYSFTYNQDTGKYIFEQFAPIDHFDGANPIDILDLGFKFTVTDNDGDSVEHIISVQVNDDTLLAVDDAGTVTEGTTLLVTAADGVLKNDDFGVDGQASPAITGVRTGDESGAEPTGSVGTQIVGLHGTLTLNADGSYSYAANGNLDNATPLTDTFSYTITDGDGDTDVAELVITINDGGIPEVTSPSGGPLALSVSETGLGDAVDTSEADSGTITFQAGSDNIQTVVFDGTTDPVVGLGDLGAGESLTWALTNGNTWTGTDSEGVDAIVLTLSGGTAAAGNTGTATVTATLSDELKHALGGGTIDISGVNVVATDTDGDTATAPVTVAVVDDVPDANNDVDSVDDASNTATGNVMTGSSTVGGTTGSGVDDEGADGADVTGIVNGTGTVGTSLTATGAYGTITIDADGNYTYTVTASSYPAGAKETFTYELTDGDGDKDAAELVINLGDLITPPTVSVEPVANGGLYEDTEGSILVKATPNGDDQVQTVTVSGIPTGATVGAVITVMDAGGTTLPATVSAVSGGEFTVTLTSPFNGPVHVKFDLTAPDQSDADLSLTASATVIDGSLSASGTSGATPITVDAVVDGSEVTQGAAAGSDNAAIDLELTLDLGGDSTTGTSAPVDADQADVQGGTDTDGSENVTTIVVTLDSGTLADSSGVAYAPDTVGGTTWTFTPADQAAAEALVAGFKVNPVSSFDGTINGTITTTTVDGTPLSSELTSANNTDVDSYNFTVDVSDTTPTISVNTTDGVVSEAALPDGTSPGGAEGLTASGTFDIDANGTDTSGGDTLAKVEVQNENGSWVDVTGGGTVTGDHGELVVSVDGSGNYSWTYTLSDNTTTHTDISTTDGDSDRGADDTVPDNFGVRVTDSDGDQSTSTFSVTVEDDGPLAEDDVADCTNESTVSDYNLVITLDESGSMFSGGRLAAMQNAVKELLDAYNEVGSSVTVQFVQFASDAVLSDGTHGNGGGAAIQYTLPADLAAAKAFVDGLDQNGLGDLTSYEDALTVSKTAIEALETANPNAENAFYFFSDGSPTTDNQSSGDLFGHSDLQTFFTTHGVTAHAVGILLNTTDVDLEVIDNTSDGAVYVPNDLDQLTALVLDTVPGVSSGNILANDNVGADDFAGTNKVVSVTHDVDGDGSIGAGETFTPNVDGKIEFTTEAGGKIVINAQTGNYVYFAPSVDSDITEVVTYTIEDGDGDQSSADLTLCVKDVVDPISGNITGEVSEAALDQSDETGDLGHGTVTGSDPSSTDESSSGTFDLATGSAITSFEYTDVNGAVVSGTVGTVVTTEYGLLKVNADGTYQYTLTKDADHSGGPVSETVTVTATKGSVSDTATLTLDITDDVPTAVDDAVETTTDSSVLPQNIAFVVDESGSVGQSNYQSQIDGVRTFITDLVTNGAPEKLAFSLVTFGSNAEDYGSFVFQDNGVGGIDLDDFVRINNNGTLSSTTLDDTLTTVRGNYDNGGSTNYDSGMQSLFSSNSEYLTNPITDLPLSQNHLYFISDGEPNSGSNNHDEIDQSVATSIINNDVQVTGIGIGTSSGVQDGLEDYFLNQGGGDSGNPKIPADQYDFVSVPNFANLAAQLLAASGTTQQIASGSLIANDDLGADGASVTAISIDGVPATFNGSTNSWELDGATFEFGYNPATDEFILIFDEGEAADLAVNYTITDGDGDTSSAVLNITVPDPLSAVDDSIITNITSGDVDIPDWVLTQNDGGSSARDISGVSNATDGSISHDGSADETIFTLPDNSFGSGYTVVDEAANDDYDTPLNDTRATAVDLTDRSQWGPVTDGNAGNVKNAALPSILFKGDIDNKNSGNNRDYDMVAVSLLAGEKLILDIDNGSSGSEGVDTRIRLYDASGSEIDQNDDAFFTNGGAGSTLDYSSLSLDSYLEYTASLDGTYYVRVQSYDRNDDGDYDLWLSVDNSGVSTPTPGFDYTVEDGGLSDDASVLISTVDSSTLTGTDDGEILIGGSLADIINAGGGDDILIGGAGANVLTGGTGSDTFVLSDINSQDVITDFNGTADDGDGDILNLHDLLIEAGLDQAALDGLNDGNINDHVHLDSTAGVTTVSVSSDGNSFTTVATLSGVGDNEIIKVQVDDDHILNMTTL